MEDIWQECVDKKNDVFVESSYSDTYKMLSNDFSYVLSENPNTGQQNVIDTLTPEQRSKHPKFIHGTGLIGKFKYLTRVAQFDAPEKLQLCTENMTGIFRYGPANQGAVNMLGFGFKFFRESLKKASSKKSIYNTLMIGGTANKIDPKYLPTVGDVKYYSTDITQIGTGNNNKVAFLARAFSDLVTDPNILNVSKFIHKYERINFEFNPQLMKDFESVKHDELIVENVKNVINANMLGSKKTNYVIGTFYAMEANGTYKIELGDVILSEPVIISNYANSFLFFQHDLDNVKPKKSQKSHNTFDTLNENENSQSVCIFARRIKHLFV